jgi:hypothetical protein
MKKLVIASAVAAVMASGSVMADTTLGGEVRLKLQHKGETALNSGKLTVKINSSEDLGNGMTGFAYLEMENDSADNETTGFSNDKSYVGIKGDFGQLTLGAQSDAAGFACGGTDIFTDNSGSTCGVGAYNGTLDNAVTYVKGVGPVTFVVGLTFDGDLKTGEMTDGGASGAQPAGGNHSVIALNFDGGMFTVGGQITSPDSEVSDDNGTDIGGTVKLGEGTLGLTYGDNGSDDDNTAFAVAYSMPLAGGTIKVGIDSGDALEAASKAAAAQAVLDAGGTAAAAAAAADDAGNGTVTNIEFKKSLGKQTYAGVQYSSVDGDDDDLVQAYMGYNF